MLELYLTELYLIFNIDGLELFSILRLKLENEGTSNHLKKYIESPKNKEK